MRIELLTIGDELLLGYTTDTNGAYLARALSALGAEVVRRTSVRDDAADIVRAVREALERTGAVITTGGLGPTSDDMTRPAIAELFGRPLHLDDRIVAQIETRFRRFGAGPMPKSNIVQAMVPEGARVLENHFGTAPGLWIEDERGRWVAMLPGVPREMRGMTDDTIVPLLRERVGDDPPVVLSRTIRTTGIGESALAEFLGDMSREVEGLAIAYLPGWEGVDLRLTVRGAPRADAEARLASASALLRCRAERYVYGEDGEDLAAVVLARAREARLRIATAESCTGGMLGERITAIPGSSDVYIGGIVAYDNAVKVTQLGVQDSTLRTEGAVSERVAREMATGARTALGADVGIAITGVAGPGGGSPEKPVGTVWIALDVRDEVTSRGRNYIGDRDEVRRRSAQAALDLVRRALA